MKPDRASAEGNLAKDIVFTLLTCGIYGLFWQNRIFKTTNALCGEEKYKFLSWFILTIFTCGIYNIYIQYQLGQVLHEGLVKEGGKGNDSLPVLGLILNLVGLHIVGLAIQQSEINKLYN